MHRRRCVLSVATVLTVTAFALTACSSDTTAVSGRQRTVQSTSTDVSFHKCAGKCDGTLDGAKYEIKLPAKWNGTLLLYSHGYRFATPGPPDFSAVQTNAQVTSLDADGSGTDAVSKALLAQGYALAGSSYKSNGWAVADGVQAGEQLYKKFVGLVGKPQRTYVWGDSLGGLITEILAEKDSSFVDGAAPMCGAVAGPNLNFDVALDVAFAIKTLIDPQLQLTGYASAEQADAQWKQAAAKMIAAAKDTAHGGTAKALFIGSLVDAPHKTATYDGHDIQSQVAAVVESALTALAFGTAARYEIEQRVGGNASSNVDTDYAQRISAPESALIKLVGGDPAAYEKQLAAAPRISADAAARKRFEQLGDTTGKIQLPTLTMHTENDPLVLVSNESVLAQRARTRKSSGDLVQLYVAPPTTYSTSSGAPYGAGHCIFSVKQRVGLIDTLNNWVQKGVYPTPQGVSGAFGPGLDPAFTPTPWPAPQAK
ncbi:hypothetical protein [uncultured Jatrophihabitans sp.]|uniref:hypothetical protein n=1 Tax=uncultured Jatrophihabitans sp. TaxID=1610747 RepID=UPI0035CAC6E9